MTISMRARLSAKNETGMVSQRSVLNRHFPTGPISLRWAAEDPVISACLDFEFSNKPGAWKHIPKSPLLQEMIDRLHEPLKVDQKKTPLCGPAAIVYELVSRKKIRYVQIMRQLYETGKFKAWSKWVDPSQDTRDSAKAASTSYADWMLMAALRDTENAIFDVEGDSGDFIMGLSTPWEMKGWAEEILEYPHTSFTSTFVYGEFDALREAEQALKNGGVAFLLIHSALLPAQDQPVIAVPQHWVSFKGDLVIDEGNPWVWESGHVRFKCYTWGKIVTVDADEGDFEDYMFGVVTAKL